MAQSGGRYNREDSDNRESGSRRDRSGNFESDQRYGRGQQDEDYGNSYRSSSARGGWQNRSMGSQGGEWGRMGRYGEEANSQGYDNRDDDRRYDAYRGYGGTQDYNAGDYGRQNHGGSGNWSTRGGAGSGNYRSEQNERGFMDKASDEVSSWFGDGDARRRRERDEHRGRGPKGYARSDERIKEDINDRLTDDGALDASEIEVQISSREVTLSGEVNSREDKRRAEDIAEMVSGVQHVQNNLRVKNRSGMTSGSAMSAGTGSTAGQAGTTTGKTGTQRNT